jgi:hypothetical protein
MPAAQMSLAEVALAKVGFIGNVTRDQAVPL